MTEPRNRIREIAQTVMDELSASAQRALGTDALIRVEVEPRDFSERVARRVLEEALPIAARYFFDEPGPHDILSCDDALRAHFGLRDGNQ